MIGRVALKNPAMLMDLQQVKGISRLVPFSYIGPTYAQNATPKWADGVLVGNIIYGIPLSETRMMKIDTVTDTVTEFGSIAGVSKWQSGALANNGHVYMLPSNAATIGKLTLPGETVTTFGALGATTAKYQGAVKAPNGMIYGVPYNATVVAKVNPTTDVVTTFGSLAGAVKWYGGVLVGNNIYCAPGRSAQCLVIDTTNDTTRLIGSFGATSGLKWSGCCVGADGNIYFMPYGELNILVMRPDESFYKIPVGNYQSGSGAARIGNRIFAAPFYLYNGYIDTSNGGYILSQDLTFVSPSNYYGIVAAPNGKLYCPPTTYARVMKISPP